MADKERLLEIRQELLVQYLKRGDASDRINDVYSRTSYKENSEDLTDARDDLNDAESEIARLKLEKYVLGERVKTQNIIENDARQNSYESLFKKSLKEFIDDEMLQRIHEHTRAKRDRWLEENK